jgi:hypothetical protein
MEAAAAACDEEMAANIDPVADGGGIRRPEVDADSNPVFLPKDGIVTFRRRSESKVRRDKNTLFLLVPGGRLRQRHPWPPLTLRQLDSWLLFLLSMALKAFSFSAPTFLLCFGPALRRLR